MIFVQGGGSASNLNCVAVRRIAWVKLVRSQNRFPTTTREPVPVFRCAKRQYRDLNGYGQTRYSACPTSTSGIHSVHGFFPCLSFCPFSFLFFRLFFFLRLPFLDNKSCLVRCRQRRLFVSSLSTIRFYPRRWRSGQWCYGRVGRSEYVYSARYCTWEFFRMVNEGEMR